MFISITTLLFSTYFLLTKDVAKYRISGQKLLCAFAVLLYVQIGVAVRLHVRSRFDRSGEVRGFHAERFHVREKARRGEEVRDTHEAVFLNEAHEVARNADLDPVELRRVCHLVERVRNKVFAAARGSAAAGNLHGDPAHGERVDQFSDEEAVLEPPERGLDDAVDRFFREKHGEVIDL